MVQAAEEAVDHYVKLLEDAERSQKEVFLIVVQVKIFITLGICSFFVSLCYFDPFLPNIDTLGPVPACNIAICPTEIYHDIDGSHSEK